MLHKRTCSNTDVAAPALLKHHYVIVRTDLPRGVQFAQTIHAAGASSPGNLSPGTYAIALAAKSEIQLLAIEKRLISQNIPHAAIREPDRNNELMAIGLVPSEKTPEIRSVVSQLPLLGRDAG